MPNDDLDVFAAFALEASAGAAAIARSYFRSRLDIEDKADASPVTIADRETEQALRDAISARFPDHAIVGEEFAEHDAGGASPYRWVIDPIDGTRSFVTGHPLYGLLMALLKDDAPVLGLVRMPELGEAYIGAGGHAAMNGTPIATSAASRLADARVYVCQPNWMMANAPQSLDRLLGAPRLVRLSYDCYPHALLAAGHVDATVDCDLQPYDFLPLVALVEGAGGCITDWHGAPLTPASDGRIVCAATPRLHEELLGVLTR